MRLRWLVYGLVEESGRGIFGLGFGLGEARQMPAAAWLTIAEGIVFRCVARLISSSFGDQHSQGVTREQRRGQLHPGGLAPGSALS